MSEDNLFKDWKFLGVMAFSEELSNFLAIFLNAFKHEGDVFGISSVIFFESYFSCY
ncbi:MAG: hypothetical protein ACK4F9_06440 [Brevinematia bacterium]